MVKFGWCQTGHHGDCKEKYQRFYNGQQRVKRKMVDTVIFLEEWVECNCTCHRPATKKSVRKTRKKSNA